MAIVNTEIQYFPQADGSYHVLEGHTLDNGTVFYVGPWVSQTNAVTDKVNEHKAYLEASLAEAEFEQILGE